MSSQREQAVASVTAIAFMGGWYVLVVHGGAVLAWSARRASGARLAGQRLRAWCRALRAEQARAGGQR